METWILFIFFKFFILPLLILVSAEWEIAIYEMFFMSAEWRRRKLEGIENETIFRKCVVSSAALSKT